MSISKSHLQEHYYYKSHDIQKLIDYLTKASYLSRLIYVESILFPDDPDINLKASGCITYFNGTDPSDGYCIFSGQADYADYERDVFSITTIPIRRQTYDLLSSGSNLVKDRYLTFWDNTIHVLLDMDFNITQYVRIYAKEPVINSGSGDLLDISWKNDYIENVIAIQKLIEDLGLIEPQS